jgi:TolB-like protein
MLDIGPESIVPPSDVTRYLARITQSGAFINSVRLSTFLRFAVEQTLAGRGDLLKEYTIGTNAYGRRADFDPSQDTIVRTEARRLRQKLQEYYSGEGKDDEVAIVFRSGSYVPVISWREHHGRLRCSTATSPVGLKAMDAATRVVVQAFVAPPSDPAASEFAFGISEELLHRLFHVEGLCVIAETAGNHFDALAADHCRVDIIVGGTVRRECGFLRITTRGSAATGQMLWSHRLDTGIEDGAALNAQEAVATSVIQQISPHSAHYIQETPRPVGILQ